MGRDMERDTHTQKDRAVWAEADGDTEMQREGERYREKGEETGKGGGESDAETEKRRGRDESERELLGGGQTGRKMERDMERDRDRDGVERRTDGGGRTREQVGTGPGPEFPGPRRRRVLSAASPCLGSRLRLFGPSDS